MVALLASPELTFVDSNGAPYAGGTLSQYVPGTTTAKTSWKDSAGTVANGNPLTLDAAGRCILWGDGVYRLVLKAADGTLIWDQLSSTLVSSAMAPVCIASTLAAARTAMGIDAAIAVETTRALAAEAALSGAGSGAATTAALAAETAARAAADTAETLRAEAAEAALAASIHATFVAKGGTAATSADGHCRVTFPTPFSSITSFVAMPSASGLYAVSVNASFDNAGADVYLGIPATAGPAAFGFSWIAMGT